MIDLTEIDTPFGLLDEDTQKALKRAYERRQPMERLAPSGWIRKGGGPLLPHLTYRLAPEPLRDIGLSDKAPDHATSVWDLVPEKWVHLARDENGALFFYTKRPEPAVVTWRGDAGVCMGCGVLSDWINPGNKPWNQSLITRPGCEEAWE